MKATTFVAKEQFGKKGDLDRVWLCIDATDQTLGRLSSQIVRILQGKHKPIFSRHVDTGDFVVVINAEKIRMTGNKLRDKMYYHHTGYPGGLKAVNAETLLNKKPIALITKAVKGMLPKNKLYRKALFKLKVYEGPEHPHQAQKPETFEIKY